MSELVVALDARLAAGDSTGDSSYWTGLLHGLSQIAAKARFLLFSNAPRPKGIPNRPNFEWVSLPAKSSRWWSYAAFPLAAKKAGAQAIHTQYTLSPLVGSRGITTVHDVSFYIGPEWFRRKDLLILRRTIPASVRIAARVLTVSETSKGEILKYLPAADGKIVAIPLACPVHIDPNSSTDVRERFGLNGGYLLTVGTRWPRKNMQLAVDAAAKAGMTLVVTGKQAWGKEDFPENVVTTGYLDAEALSALYRHALLYLAPSRHEGFGLPVLEAFACGCPVLCSGGGALPETAGDAAVVNRSWRSSDWADSILALVHDSSKLDNLRLKGHARVAQFSWEETARQTMEVYREVALENKS